MRNSGIICFFITAFMLLCARDAVAISYYGYYNGGYSGYAMLLDEEDEALTEITIPAQATVDGVTMDVVFVTYNHNSEDGKERTPQFTNLKKLVIEDSDSELLMDYIYIWTGPYSGDYIGMFAKCSTLEEIYLGRELDHGYYEPLEVGFNEAPVKKLTFAGSVKKAEWGGNKRDHLEELIIKEPVKEVWNFSGSTNLTSVSLPNSLKTIYDYAFAGCTGLTSIALPNSLESIGDEAFSGCTGLTSFTLPGSVVDMGWRCFKGCRFDTFTVEYGETKFTREITLDYCKTLNVNRIGGYYDCPKVTELNIGKDITALDQQFMNIENLERFTMPANINVVIAPLFEGCEGIKTLTFEESTEPLYLTGNLFDNSPGLEVLNLDRDLYYGPITVGGTHDYDCKPSFANTKELTTINFGPAFTKIVPGMFSGCESLRSVSIPDGVEMICDKAFSGCLKLKSVNIEDSDKSITIESSTENGGYGTTFLLAPIETIYMGRNIEYKGTELSPFRNLISLHNLTIGNKVTEINDYLYYGCANLTMMAVPSSVKRVGGYAFYDCCEAKTLTISRSVEEIGEYAFYNCNKLKRVSIPNSVVTIGDYAFRSCSGAETIKIGDAVETIGQYAFLDCFGAKTITIGGSVKTIGDNAFYNCASLQHIEVPNSVKTIGDNAFALCVEAVDAVIGEGVTEVGMRAFADCESLKSLTLGASVADVGMMAFFNCESLQSVYARPQVPPMADETVFSDYSATLYVPSGCLASYKNASDDCWPLFTSCRESSFDYSGIDLPSMPDADIPVSTGDGYIDFSGCDAGMDVTVVSLDGKVVYSGRPARLDVAPGVYVVRAATDAVKVLVK